MWRVPHRLGAAVHQLPHQLRSKNAGMGPPGWKIRQRRLAGGGRGLSERRTASWRFGKRRVERKKRRAHHNLCSEIGPPGWKIRQRRLAGGGRGLSERRTASWRFGKRRVERKKRRAHHNLCSGNDPQSETPLRTSEKGK